MKAKSRESNCINNEHEVPIVSKEFIKEGQIFSQISRSNKKKGGRYTKAERDKRIHEVHKLHFDYGYSARKISELMNVNRNTINGDIDYWYSKIFQNANILDPEDAILVNLQRLDIQRSRLRMQLDKTKSFQENMALERLIYDIDSKILYTHHRIAESVKRLSDFSTGKLNDWLKMNNIPERYMTLFDQKKVSQKTSDRIQKMIKEDRRLHQ